ncbi:hypothetical protein LIER_18915 [Lithospermum erythrorhizon]|uniref:Uncharacterized protein n=1 Tax=Lithospermum erythrorhizon TaxID=34254 RepID=A0AAV3QFS8_LITER
MWYCLIASAGEVIPPLPQPPKESVSSQEITVENARYGWIMDDMVDDEGRLHFSSFRGFFSPEINADI